MSMSFNRLSAAQDERLAMLAEEASEIIKAVCKIQRHGYDSHNPDNPEAGSNAKQLQGEIDDLIGVIIGMAMGGDPVTITTETRAAVKWSKKLRYAHHQGPQQ